MIQKLKLENIEVRIKNKIILKDISYEFQTGIIYAIIGANGAGKSTLLSSIIGKPNLEVTNGNISLNDQSILNWTIDKRARKGIHFISQKQIEIHGVSNIELLKESINKRSENNESYMSVYADAKQLAKKINFDESLIKRDINQGLSGGEEKKNEFIHALMLKPSFILLDELDSGLDVDAVNDISKMIKKDENHSYIVVSHYKNLYKKIKPDKVLIIENGKIIKEGNYELLINTLEKGFKNE